VSGPSGSSTTQFGYNTDGQETSVSGSSSSSSLSWNDTGQLSSVTTTGGTGAGTTTYLYDADGNLLLQADPGSTTLFLSGEELVADGSTVTGTRYYSINGMDIAARTGGSNPQVYFLILDREGTDQLAIDAYTLDSTQRFYDPYGNPIGSAPSA
jgi:YD repeat-containing protein